MSDTKQQNLTHIIAECKTPAYEKVLAERRPYDAYRPYRVTMVKRKGFRTEAALLRYCIKEFGLKWTPTEKEATDNGGK